MGRMILRRHFLKLMAWSGTAFIFGRIGSSPERCPDFYVAGARFHDLATSVQAGDRVLIRREPFGEESFRFAIVTTNGLVLGHVPKKLLAGIETSQPTEGRLIEVNLDAVPWLRYRVKIA